MIIRLLKLGIVVIAVYAVMHSPSVAARNVRVAGTAAIHVIGNMAESAGKFVEALLQHK